MTSLKMFRAHLLIGIAMLLGGGSLLILGLFFFLGSWQFFDLGFAPLAVLIWDFCLCTMFCFQHSAMIRHGFRRRMGVILPEAYHGLCFAWASGLALLILLLLWQTSSVTIWTFDGFWWAAIRGVNALTVLGFLWGTGALESLDTFGHRSLLNRIQGNEPPASSLHIRGPYRWVRHPLYFFVLLLLWICPECTADRLVLNVTWTVWIVLGSVLEERDLVAEFGEPYRDYQKRVPMLLPRFSKY